MLIRQLEYLVSLARERHFARAARACRVSQPALSAGIRKLEADLDVPIVQRGNRFEGFTPEGERVLGWAHRILAERDALRMDVASMREGQTGLLRIGVVPAAAGTLAMLMAPFSAAHPRVRLQSVELQPAEIRQRLAEFDLDAGLLYLHPESAPGLGGARDGAVPGQRAAAVLTHEVPLYRERYVLLVPVDSRYAGRERVTWTEIADAPLAALASDTAECGVFEEVYRNTGIRPAVRVHSGSVAGLYAHVQESGWPGVLAHSWLRVIGPPPGTRPVVLVEPEFRPRVGLVVPQRACEPPLVRELVAFSRDYPIQRRLDEVLTSADLVEPPFAAVEDATVGS